MLAVVGVALTGLIAWMRWSLTTAVEAVVTRTVNGRIDRVHDDVRWLKGWTESHDRKHGYEQRQLIDALRRQGIEPADGWED